MGPRCQSCGNAEFTNLPGHDGHGRCTNCRTFPTLGFQAVDWMAAWCVIPDRDEAGEPFRPTDEQGTMFLHHYRIDPFATWDGKRWSRFWHYPRGTQVEKPQKWGKAPMSSAWVCVEAAPDGPVLFDGWDAQGAPVGKPWPSPHVQVTACSEDQTDNVWRALLPMIQLGPLADVFHDAGLTRINLPTGGLIEPVTAAAISRLGQRITATVQDQTESWFATNGGHKLADNQRRGLAGTGGRFLSTPNAWDPVEDSVAQRTSESNAPGVYESYRPPIAGSVRNKAERKKVLRDVYGDSVIERGGWIDVDRIDVEIEALLEHDPSQAERWFLNRRFASEGAAFDFEAWKDKAQPKRQPKPGATIVLGIDGALNDDALAVIAAEVEAGFCWPVGIWERPKNAAPDYEHPRHEVDGAVSDAFETYDVWRAYCDPQHIRGLMEGWQNRYGEKRVIDWPTYRKMPIAWAVRELEQAISRTTERNDDGRPPLTHSGDETLTAHVQNSRKRKLTVQDDKQRTMHTLSKPAQHSPLKIDGAMGLVLAWKCLGDAIKAGAVWMGEDPPTAVEPKKADSWAPNTAPSLQDLVSAGPALGDFS